ncbi:MAG: SRPBCC family protein [Flavobacteriales bacterium]|nr:SRPBCC family protein [Flavobacteriales bacterium]
MRKTLTTLVLSILVFSVQAQSSISLGKTPTEITVEIEINAPIKQVWAEFENIGSIFLNSPTVDTSFTSSEQKTGVGATRHMVLSPMIKKGATLDERVLIWEEGTYQKLEVYKLYKVSGMKTMGGDFRLIEKGDKTILRSTLNYSMKNGIWGLMNKMMGKKKFAKVWKNVIAGYKYHIETGQEVTHKTKLKLDAVDLIEIKILKP